jgi:hypothetical protein
MFEFLDEDYNNWLFERREDAGDDDDDAAGNAIPDSIFIERRVRHGDDFYEYRGE